MEDSALADFTDILDSSVDKNDGDSMTPAELIDCLEQLWISESQAPNLLPCRSEIVDTVMEQLDSMEDNLKRAKNADLKIPIHRLEVDRIRYVLTAYLRCRVKKIERYSAALLREEPGQRMTQDELNLAREYDKSIMVYLEAVALRHMPSNLQPVDSAKTMPQPDLDTHVFVRVNQDVDGVLVDDDATGVNQEVIDLKKGDQHVMRYRSIMSLVEDGSVSLI